MRILLLLFIAIFVYAIDYDKLEEPCFKKAATILQNTPNSALNKNEAVLKLYLLAVFLQDSKVYLDESENAFKQTDTTYTKAALGSIETLKARDFASNEAARSLLSLTPVGFVRIYYVGIGKKLLDESIKEYPNDPTARFIRAMTYFALPSPFAQAGNGYEDAKWMLLNIRPLLKPILQKC